MKSLPLFLLVSIALSPVAFSQNYLGKPKQIRQILENVEQFSRYVMNSDYEEIAACYTEDAKIFPNNLEIIEGRKAIQKYWMPKGSNRTIFHKITPSEIKIQGNEAYDYGIYEGTTRTESGEKVSWKGKYVIIWRKEQGEWKIYLDIWNRIKE